MDWNVIVNAIVGGIVCWYTIETKKIRQQGRTQLELMQAQLKGSQEQLKLFADEVEVARNQLQLSREQGRLTQKPYVMIISLKSSSSEWDCVADNPTGRICHHVHILYAEKLGGDLKIWSSLPHIDLLMQGKDFALQKDVDLISAPSRIESLYGKRAGEEFTDILNGNAASYIAVFYQDVENFLYMDCRHVFPDFIEGCVFGPCQTKLIV